MTDEIEAGIRGLRNPFLLDRVDSAWDGAFTDVGTINQQAYQQCRTTIQTVRDTQQSRGLLLTGEPGSGKSHLLHRLRQSVIAEGHDCFVYVPPVAAADRLTAELLRRSMTDIIRQGHDGAATQLEAMVVRSLLHGEVGVTPKQIFDDMRKRYPPGPTLFSRLERHFDALTLRTQIDADVALVLRHYLAEHFRMDAYRWLTANSLPEDVLARLGVSHSLEEESEARRALFALSHLAGANSVLILAFDQLEGMQVGPDDLDGVRAFGNAVADLLTNCRNIAVVTCVQQYFYGDLKKALPTGNMQRVSQDIGTIRLLTLENSIELVGARLANDEKIAAAQQALRQDSLWPLKATDLKTSFTTQEAMPARAVVHSARILFEKWRDATASPSVTTDANALSDHYEKLREAASQAAPDEGVLADGLLKLLDLAKPQQAKRSVLRGVDIELATPSGTTGIALCNSQNMTKLATRLRHIGEAITTQKVRRVVVIRDARLPISATAHATQERLQELTSSGNTLLRPGAATYAALAAARDLLAEANAGDLSVDGRTVPADAVRRWLLDEKPMEAFQLISQLHDPSGDEPDEVLDKLRASLNGTWLMALDQAAAHAGVSSTLAFDCLLSGQSMVGLIQGSPSVIFLRPDGLMRN